MKNARVEERLRVQHGVVSAWQLEADGMSRRQVDRFGARHRSLHQGVWVTGHAPVTPEQRRWAAVSSAPGSVLTRASAGAAWGMRENRTPLEWVTRPGSGGRRRFGELMVHRSLTMGPEVTLLEGLPVTTPARTIIDLAGELRERQLRRVVREGVRLGALTIGELAQALRRHRGHRGVGVLRVIAEEYADLPLDEALSDAEAIALPILTGAGVALPEVNADIAGESADLSWPAHRLIVELDGPDFHRFLAEDLRKEERWRAAGWTVRRLSTNDVFDRPDRLLDLVPAPSRPPAGA